MREREREKIKIKKGNTHTHKQTHIAMTGQEWDPISIPLRPIYGSAVYVLEPFDGPLRESGDPTPLLLDETSSLETKMEPEKAHKKGQLYRERGRERERERGPYQIPC